MANDSLAAELARAVPDSLDSIIRGPARDKVALRLASADELALLSGPVPSGLVKDELEDWRVVCIAMKSHPPSFFIVGYARRAGTVWGTSRIEAISPDGQLVRTGNSLYRLLAPGAGEPDPHQLLHVCAILHHRKVGKALGVPHVFY